jgi:hypothetical protein
MEQQVFNRDQLQAVLNEVTLVNSVLDFNWQFEVADCKDEHNPGWFVNVSFERPDTATNEMGVGRSRKEFVALGAWESGIVKTCWVLLDLTVRHELMEGFRWRNKRIFNPHNSIYDLASIQK